MAMRQSQRLQEHSKLYINAANVAPRRVRVVRKPGAPQLPQTSAAVAVHPMSPCGVHPRPNTYSRRCSTSCAAATAQAGTSTTVLVGDIGGTNARLSLWTSSATSHKEVYHHTFPTKDHDTFEDIVQTFLQQAAAATSSAGQPQSAAFACAGAVENNTCPMTNTKLVVDGHQLSAALGIPVAVLNDFEAVGYGIPALTAADLVVVNDVPVVPEAPKVVMGPGTGLGAAQLMWDGGVKAYRVWPGEGSHATFAPRGWKQQALERFVTAKYGYCEIEQVACGPGLELIYQFLATDEVPHRPEHLPASPKTAPEITTAALDGSDPLAVEAVDMLMAIVGAEAGAMALRCLARGGVYIAGGITPRVMQRVQQGTLLEGFLMKTGRQRFSGLLQQMPLFVITNTKVGIIGTREYALRLLA